MDLVHCLGKGLLRWTGVLSCTATAFWVRWLPGEGRVLCLPCPLQTLAGSQCRSVPCNPAKLVLLQLTPAALTSLVILALGSARREGFRADLGNFQPLRAAWKAWGCQGRNTKHARISRLHRDRECWWSKGCQTWWRSKAISFLQVPSPLL